MTFSPGLSGCSKTRAGKKRRWRELQERGSAPSAVPPPAQPAARAGHAPPAQQARQARAPQAQQHVRPAHNPAPAASAAILGETVTAAEAKKPPFWLDDGAQVHCHAAR